MFPSLPWPLIRRNGDAPQSPARQRSLLALLDHYDTPGVSPPSSRVDPTLKQQQTQPIRLWDVWKYGAFIASKATTITVDVLSHHIWGPRKKSWGIQMTIISSFMRDAARHSGLVDITTIRFLMGIGGLVPLPSDALVTPVSFRVRRRQLRGFLAELDAKENGRRELSGEWVVGKQLWHRLQAEWKASRKAEGTLHKPSASKQIRQKERVVLYLHGGAYYLSSAAAQRLISIPLSKYTDARVFALDYRLAPETRFPGPLHDVVVAYFRLIDDLHIPPENIVIAGDSAGGGLALALLLYLRDNDYPIPGGAILMSPWVDLTMSCDSWISNAQYDVVPLPAPDDHLNPISLYLGDDIERYVTHPYASPLFGDLKDLPPLLIQAGEAEVLRDEITLFAHKASLAGVEVRYELYEDAIHVFQTFPFLDAAQQAFLSAREFVRNVLPGLQSRSPKALNDKAESVLENEIDNEKARVVGGDGVESATSKLDVKEQVEEEEGEDSDSDSGSEDQCEDQKVFPSWGRKAPLPPRSRRPSLSSGDDVDPMVEHSQSPTQGLRRIHSSFSGFIPYSTPSPAPAIPRRRYHHRGLSASNMVFSNSSPPDNVLLAQRANKSSICSSIPSPSIRRSSASHPDITSLVQQWTNSGPANQATLYKPQTSTA